MLGKRLNELRKERHLTTRQLGEILGVSNSTITMYEKGKRNPSIETLERIADYFNVDIDYLLGKSDETTFVYLDETTKRIAEMVRRLNSYQKRMILKMVESMYEDENN